MRGHQAMVVRLCGLEHLQRRHHLVVAYAVDSASSGSMATADYAHADLQRRSLVRRSRLAAPARARFGCVSKLTSRG